MSASQQNMNLYPVTGHVHDAACLLVQGFCMVFVLFLCCAAGYDKLVSTPTNLHWFQVSTSVACAHMLRCLSVRSS